MISLTTPYRQLPSIFNDTNQAKISATLVDPIPVNSDERECLNAIVNSPACVGLDTMWFLRLPGPGHQKKARRSPRRAVSNRKPLLCYHENWHSFLRRAIQKNMPTVCTIAIDLLSATASTSHDDLIAASRPRSRHTPMRPVRRP